jgi:myo-inositol 2-dehydrogenase / D-chiro-inositol 1-dehydrogenase
MNSNPSPHSSTNSNFSRRRFLAGTGASLVTFSLLEPSLVRGAEANAKINVGLMGCGGRGGWIADLFQQHGGYKVTAVSDYFQERVNGVGKRLNVPEANRYTGLSGYKRLLEQKVDAVVIQTPPYFHPEQAADAVSAGKHVYCAKPVAVDVPGCVSIAESGKRATEKKLNFFVDFQTRANQAYQEAVQKIHAGELGKTVLVEATYQCNLMFENLDRAVRQEPNNPEVRLRAWAIDRALSGDIITEQNIHALDVAAWMLNAEPIKAIGSGGRKREFIGNCWDHFAVIFHYPGDVIVSFNSHQSGFGYDDIMCRLYGLNGTVDTHYAGKVTVHTRDFRSDGNSGNLYKDGTVANIETFHKCVTSGDCSNPTVPSSVRSNLTTILGRTAAYRGREMTWEEMMRANERLVADLKGLRA